MIIEKGIPAWDLNEVQKASKQEFITWINENSKIDLILNCPYCKSTKLMTLSDVDRFALTFETKLCNECGLVFTNPQIKENYLPEYYNRFYHPLIFGEVEVKEYLFANKQGQKIFNIVDKFLQKKEVAVFEVGAGAGSNLIGFKKEAEKFGINCELHGLEYSQDYVVSANANGINLLNKSLKEYVSNNNVKFDVIILSHVFEHVVDFNEFIKDIKTLMNATSILYIEVPGILKLHRNLAYSANFRKYLVHAHIYHFTSSSLNNIVSEHGLKNLLINEIVESVYMINVNNNFSISNNSNKIIEYIKSLEKYNTFFNIYLKLNIVKNRIKSKVLRILNK